MFAFFRARSDHLNIKMNKLYYSSRKLINFLSLRWIWFEKYRFSNLRFGPEEQGAKVKTIATVGQLGTEWALESKNGFILNSL